jgi:hypothetical protein
VIAAIFALWISNDSAVASSTEGPTWNSHVERAIRKPAECACADPARSQPGDGACPAAPPDEIESTARCGGVTGFRRFGCDSRALGERFLLRDKGDRVRALGTLAITGALYGYRERIHDTVLGHRSSSRTSVYDGARNLGKGVATPLIATGLYLTGLFGHDSYHKESAQILLESGLYTGILAVTGQFLIASDRPRDGSHVRALHANGHGVSGDVAIAASVVAPLDRRYFRIRPGDKPGVKFVRVAGRSLLYAGLALTAMQRMDSDAHWAPDVFLGAAAGLAVGNALCTAHEPRGPAHEAGGLPHFAGARSSLIPSLAVFPGGLGLAWSF